MGSRAIALVGLEVPLNHVFEEHPGASPGGEIFSHTMEFFVAEMPPASFWMRHGEVSSRPITSILACDAFHRSNIMLSPEHIICLFLTIRSQASFH